jgi:excisionase family DNA binding protein
MGVMPEDIVWLSTARAASRLGITPRTLYRFVDRGDVEAYRIGRVLRFRLDELDQFIERCRIEPGSLRHLYEGSDDHPDASDEAG